MFRGNQVSQRPYILLYINRFEIRSANRLGLPTIRSKTYDVLACNLYTR